MISFILENCKVCRNSCVHFCTFVRRVYICMSIQTHAPHPHFCGQAVDEFRRIPQKPCKKSFSPIHRHFIHRLWMLWKGFGRTLSLPDFGQCIRQKICSVCRANRQDSPVRNTNYSQKARDIHMPVDGKAPFSTCYPSPKSPENRRRSLLFHSIHILYIYDNIYNTAT